MITIPESIRDENTSKTLKIDEHGEARVTNYIDGVVVSSSAPFPVDIVRGTVTLNAGDIEIGAVEIKDHDSDTRVEVNSNNRLTTLNMGQLVPKEYDYISLSYTNDEITEVVYKTGGAGGTTVATLTLTYIGIAPDFLLSTITKT